jgi:CheY-like chemotaxis protein
LMDMNMPEMDGYEATRWLRAHGYKQPILALTANAMSDDSAKCKEAGCNEYLPKPVDRVQLVTVVAGYTNRKAGAEAQTNPPLLIEPATAPHLSNHGETMVSEFISDPEMAEILGEFVGRLEGQVEAMRQAYENCRWEELQRLGHRLKGAGGSYGYPLLTDAGRQLEEAVKAQDFVAASMAIERIAGMCQAAVNGYAHDHSVGRTAS